MRASWILLAALLATRAIAADLNAVAERIRTQTNDFRASQGVATLTTESRLAAAAQEFANFMARTGKYGHDADGRTPSQRAKGKGYNHCAIAENIAYEESNVEVATENLVRVFMEGWKNSPGHRKNMLDPDVTQFGIGIAKAANGRHFAVQLFSRPESEMTNFEVRNTSTATISYRVGETAYTLAPRAWHTHGICRALKVTVQGAEPVTPRNGDYLTLAIVMGRPAIRRD